MSGSRILSIALSIGCREAGLLAMTVAPFYLVGFGVWTALVGLQAPDFLVRAGVVDESLVAFVRLALFLLPLAWIWLQGGDEARRWTARPTAAGLAIILGSWIGMVLVGSVLVSISGVIITLYRNLAEVDLAPDSVPVSRRLVAAVLGFAPLAALAPGVSRLGSSPRTVLLLWCACVVGVGSISGGQSAAMADRVEDLQPATAGWVSSVLATVAGVSFSSAAGYLQQARN